MPATLPKFAGAIAGRHLGRRTPTAQMRARVVPLGPYVKRMGATQPPDTVDYTSKAAKTLAQMLGNDQYGDCTIAAALHQVGVMTALQPGGAERVPTTNEAVSQYNSICGPGDQGCYIPDVMDAWVSKGLAAGNKAVKADGYVSCKLGDQLLAKLAIYLFGGIHLGINLPRDWYTNAGHGFTWGITSSDVVGGHSIAIPGYNQQGLIVSTWGVTGLMTWDAFSDRRWVEEIYAVLSPDWYSAAGLDAHGIDVSALREALTIVKGGGDPPIPDPNPPTPNPPTPGGPGSWSGSGTVNMFGQMLPASLSGTFTPAATAKGIGTVNWLACVVDLATMYQCIAAGDWSGAAAAFDKLLIDSGLSMTEQKKASLFRTFVAHQETKAITGPYPPE